MELRLCACVAAAASENIKYTSVKAYQMPRLYTALLCFFEALLSSLESYEGGNSLLLHLDACEVNSTWDVHLDVSDWLVQYMFLGDDVQHMNVPKLSLNGVFCLQ